MANISDKVILIETRVGKYVWWPILQLVDFVEPGKKKALYQLHLSSSNNTELGAMIQATTDMLKKLKEHRHNLKMKDNHE